MNIIFPAKIPGYFTGETRRRKIKDILSRLGAKLLLKFPGLTGQQQYRNCEGLLP